MCSPNNRAQHVVHTARTWLNTPFQHQGRVKGVGVDCIGLVVASLGVAVDVSGYSRVAVDNMLQQQLQRYLLSVTISAPGDVALFCFDQWPQHVGIVSDYSDGIGLIHAFEKAGKVVEHRLDSWWGERCVGFFRCARGTPSQSPLRFDRRYARKLCFLADDNSSLRLRGP